ncbi:MAG: 4-phosphoerythronate dehydrogenase [Bacteroidales bacterium]|nr:4-phosphoerythronate dehydrogenase [Bacteroidales bacterium]
MKIVVDDKIPFIQDALHELADEVVVKGGREINAEDVKDATILVVRTRTRCNRALLEGSAVQLIVTATIGYDHLDTTYLRQAGIEWHNCPGCNATSVAQYVNNCLIRLKRAGKLTYENVTMGIIGVGHVGSAVAVAMKRMGIGRLLLNDPPREAAGEQPPVGNAWTDLTTLLAEADVISLHTPLTTDGPYPTHHLIHAESFGMMKKHPVLINAGRGGIIDEEALMQAMETGLIGEVILDTWEHEPQISLPLLYKVYIGTPHIAGYSADGKANATRMTLAAICRFLNRPMTFDIQPPALPRDFIPATAPEELALQLYDPMNDSQHLKAAPNSFEQLRGNYPLRREHV